MGNFLGMNEHLQLSMNCTGGSKGTLGTRPLCRSNFFNFHAVFCKILLNNKFSPQSQGSAPLSAKILDPPLNCIYTDQLSSLVVQQNNQRFSNGFHGAKRTTKVSMTAIECQHLLSCKDRIRIPFWMNTFAIVNKSFTSIFVTWL